MVVHIPTIKPLDQEAVLQAARNTKGIVTAEEHSIIGGLGEAIAGLTSAVHPVPVKSVGMQDVFGESGQAGELLDKYGLRARDVVRNALEILNNI